MWKASHFTAISCAAAHIVSTAVATFFAAISGKFEAITCIRGNPGNLDAAAVVSTFCHVYQFIICFTVILNDHDDNVNL